MNQVIKKIKKQFKKYHFIDLLGVGIFCACLIFIAFTFSRQSAYAVVTIRVTTEKNFMPVWQYSPTDWYLQNLKVGMKSKDIFGRTSAEVLDVYYYPQNVIVQAVYVKVKVQSVYNKNTGQYSFNGVPLLVGELQTFKIKDLSLQGVILDVSDQLSEPITKKFIVKGTLDAQYNEDFKYTGNIVYKGIRNFLADKLQKGMTVTDNQGRVVAEILDITKSPGIDQFISSNGVLSSVVDPDRQQVDLTVRFTTTLTNGRYLFRDEEPLILAHWLSLDFPDLTVNMTLMDLKSE